MHLKPYRCPLAGLGCKFYTNHDTSTANATHTDSSLVFQVQSPAAQYSALMRTKHACDGCVSKFERLCGGGPQVATNQEAAAHGEYNTGGHVRGPAQPGLCHVEGGRPECFLRHYRHNLVNRVVWVASPVRLCEV